MEQLDWLDGAVFEDGEWVGWSEINDQIRYKEWGAKYPNADRSLIPYFLDLLSMAESYHQDTGRHLNVYGDIGELYGAITYGIRLNRNYAQGADGRVGSEHVEIKTMTPFKLRNEVHVKRAGNWSKLLVVKINEDFEVSGRMIDRKKFRKAKSKLLRVKWTDLPLDQ